MSREEWEARAIAAEKTVDVLKKRVKSLYAGDSTSAFEHQLEHARKRQDQAAQKRQLVELRAAELARYSAGLEVEVASRTRDLREILDNVTSGFLLVDRRGVALPGYTRSCHELFGTETIEDVPLATLLTADRNVRSTVEALVEQVFDDVFPEEVSLDMIPNRHVVAGRVVRIDARAIRDGAGAVARLLFTVNDISSLERAQREARENQMLIGILKQRESFRLFTIDVRELLATARDAASTEGGQKFVRRTVHTVKGNAASFDLVDLVALVHTTESNAIIDDADVAAIDGWMRTFLARHASVLELDYDAMTEDDVALSGTAGSRRNEVALERADRLIGPIHTYVAKLAERLEKGTDFGFSGGEILVDPPTVRPILQNLAHLLRNAIDHGLEPEWERGDKPLRGRIDVAITDHPRDWTISVRDDGRGIDTDSVVAAAVKRGILTSARASVMTETEKLDLIFADGVTTSEVETDVSGRGIGMAAILAAVRGRGGEVRVESKPGKGTRFDLVIPKPDVLCAKRAA